MTIGFHRYDPVMEVGQEYHELNRHYSIYVICRVIHLLLQLVGKLTNSDFIPTSILDFCLFRHMYGKLDFHRQG